MNSGKGAASGAALMALFAASGFAGLIYESIWTQYLGLLLGHAAYAQSFVLILFMGGMALGAWVASRLSERLARPLVIYALIEFVVGIAGVAFDPYYRIITDFGYAYLFPLTGGGVALDVVRYLLSTLLIGAQCVLLGMTFPLMSAGYLRLTPHAGGRVLAGLYFSNSLGAALGAIVATFLLLPAVGLPGTVLTGGLISVLVAILVWPIAKQPSTPATQTSRLGAKNVTASFVLTAAAITGATSFVYEITWVRMLSLALGSTLHAFELMLSAFISGIAFGGLWLRRNGDRFPDAIWVAGWAQVAMGIAALGSLFVYANSFDWVATLLAGLGRTATGYTLYNIATGVISLAVMFPAAFFAGMTLPLLTLSLLRWGSGERAIGRVYAANTIGAIVGVLLAVHVLMPLLGVRVSLWVAALTDLALGIYLLARSDIAQDGVNRRPIVAALIVSIVAAAAGLALTNVDTLALASSVYRTGKARLPEGTDVLFHKDGKTATVSLYQTPGKSEMRLIATNGKVDAGIATAKNSSPSLDEYTMALAAILPLSVISDPANVAVIGFGSGMTAHTFLGSERVGRIDIVEIEPLMVQAAKHFGDRVDRVYSDPRAHIIIDDAKAYLAGTPRKYDVIVSEPSNPWVGGVAALFSQEFYDFIPKHLNEHGVFVQWIQLYEITPQLVGSILKAMLPRFRDVNAYFSNQGDMLLLASPAEQLPSLKTIVTQDTKFANNLARVTASNAEEIADFFFLDKRGLQALASMSRKPINSDRFPVLQLEAPKARFMQTGALDVASLEKAPWPLLEIGTRYQPPEATRVMSPIFNMGLREKPLRAAREYRAALLGDAPMSGDDASRDMVYRFEQMRYLARECNFDSKINVNAWLDASASVAAATIPYLRPADLEGVWISPHWLSHCISNTLIADARLFYAALAGRDWQNVVAYGSKLLDNNESQRASGFNAYVFGAVDLAYMALGDSKGLAANESKYGGDIKNYAFERVWMKAWMENQ